MLLQVGRLLEYLGTVGALVVLLVGVVHLVVEQLLPGGLEGDVALAGVDDVLAVVEVLGEGLVLGRVLVQASFLYKTQKLSSGFSETQMPKISKNSVFA